MVSAAGWVQRALSRLPGLGRAALPLIVSDTLLQGARYAFILFLGSYSLSLLGSFLFGAALGALLSVIVDFGINQHWIRLTSSDPVLSRMAFTRVLLAKAGLSILGMAVIIGSAGAGLWSITPLPVMAAGLFLTTLQGLAEACEAIGLALHRYRLISLFRSGLSLAMYAVPLFLGFVLAEASTHAGIYVALQTAAFAGTVMLICSAWYVARSLPPSLPGTAGYREAWWAARWLGMNQAAIVVDVRAPLVILGIMLGETAVGLYGLVQRTTAIVELAWASLSKLLLKSYSETASGSGVDEVRSRMIAASRLTGIVMAGVALSVGIISIYVEQVMKVSDDMSVALSLLRWALVAISLSSLKRPLIAGLLALYQERAVCRINVLSAVVGVALIPPLILYLGVWGPVAGWILLELAACLLLVYHFLSVRRIPRSKSDGPLSQSAGI
ncbi:MAG: hypothetical protein K0S45_1849 [Nitrospira sp.]|jgi:O-antigen/teichoic acid export membrane protein|nr:hypothetical protein [Nitrospira sp.]